MQTRSYLFALVAAVAVFILQVWSMRQANWIQWKKENRVLSTTIQYGPLRTCSKVVLRISSPSSSSASGSQSPAFNSSSAATSFYNATSPYPSYPQLSDAMVHASEKDDGFVCRSFPQTDQDCNSENDRSFCTAFLTAGYSLQLSGILLVASMISAVLTVFSHSPLNKVEGYRVVGGLMSAATLLGIVAFAIVHDAYKNDWPYLFGASLSLGAAFWTELAAWLIGLLASIGVLAGGFRAERAARTGAAPVNGYTRI
ncbi:hypothetical protein OC846_002233 [Tilletia horrida]|uniref:Uncharacterized protein n=1 Tax=Tilletia horrida TaxID=155126 RepID=A0AAN6GSP2_9BASI|nr:hypothetical protein OC846_002233 [Tilletia horrida]KAK0568976.1 hypothetical protein OC861_001413 [Tilletia horrida]